LGQRQAARDGSFGLLDTVELLLEILPDGVLARFNLRAMAATNGL
jgi:hypothetical protein